MAAARASVADISSVSFIAQAVSSKCHFRRFPRPSLVAAIIFPHTKWPPKITDYRDTAALRFSSTCHCSFLFRCNNRLFTDILAGCSFNKRVCGCLLKVCECLLPANHPSRNIAMYNKTISWKKTNSLVNILKKLATKLLFLISKIDVAKNGHRQNEETNTYQTQNSPFNHLNTSKRLIT